MDLSQMSPTQKLVYQLYKDETGQPIILTKGQDFIFQCIFVKKFPRVQIMPHTRYGKSFVIALATLTRLTVFPEKWAIIAPEKEKAKIIMGYIISHIFDNEFNASRYLPDKDEDVNEIRRHKSKSHLTFVVNPEEKDPLKRLLSEVFIGSAKDALGFGAPNVIGDEAGLMEDEDEALAARMVGDNPFENFYVKIGNPFRRNHFLKSFHNPHYKRVVIDYYRSLQDGRISQSLIDEMKDKPFFDVLYECKFPAENAINEEGYMQLLLSSDIELAQQRKLEPFGIRRLGVDVARGGRNFNAFVMRGDNYAQVLGKNTEENSVRIADQVVEYMKQYGIVDRAVFVDDTGVGHGVVSVLKERGLKINAVNFGEKSKGSMLLNKRAECYAGDVSVMTFVKQGAQLLPSSEWKELLRIRYRKNNSNKTQIESKEDMIRDGRESPDVADALALTFAKTKISQYTNTTPVQSASVASPFGGVQRFPGMPG